MEVHCFKCGYRREVPGSAHVRCAFDWSGSELKMPEGSEHGRKNGWWLFPLHFDPIWALDDCPAFAEKGDPAKTVEQLTPLAQFISLLARRF